MMGLAKPTPCDAVLCLAVMVCYFVEDIVFPGNVVAEEDCLIVRTILSSGATFRPNDLGRFDPEFPA